MSHIEVGETILEPEIIMVQGFLWIDYAIGLAIIFAVYKLLTRR